MAEEAEATGTATETDDCDDSPLLGKRTRPREFDEHDLGLSTSSLQNLADNFLNPNISTTEQLDELLTSISAGQTQAEKEGKYSGRWSQLEH